MQKSAISPTRFAWLSIGASLVTIVLKGSAYLLTGSVGLFSDAIESFINLAAGLIALTSLTIAMRPPDEGHPFGHDKAEYFSSGIEGGMILVAAGSIIVAAMRRFFEPQPIEQIELGLTISLIAALINLVVAQILFRAGKEHQSITLEADAQHLMTDVWTSVGMLVGIGTIALTGWYILDPIIALLVAVNILRVGMQLVRKSVAGLMDTAMPPAEQSALKNVLAHYEADGIHFHALRTRTASSRRFISLHVIVPGDWSVRCGHDLLKKIESDIQSAVSNAIVFTHLEPIEDPDSWKDKNIEII